MGSLAVFSRSLGGIQLDAVLSEVHTSDLVVTDNPIENGAVGSDHAYPAPRRYSMTAGVGSIPLNDDGSIIYSDASARVSAAYEQLLRLQRDANPFSIQTGLFLYENMLILSLSVTQDKDSDQALNFTAEMREVQFTDSITITLPPQRLREGGVRDRGASTSNRGEVTAVERDTTSSSPEATEYKSWLKQLLGGDE